jgi:hypothetical protein
MKSKLYLVCLIVLLFIAIVPTEAAQPRPQFYTSAWTVIDGNDCAQFVHGFDKRPLMLDIWVRMLTRNVPPDEQLWVDGYWDLTAIANAERITVCNTADDASLTVQVVAQGMR